MTTLCIKAWHRDKAWAGESGFTHHMMSRRLQRITSVRGVALRRLTRGVLRREALEIPLHRGVDPESFVSYLESYGAEVTICLTLSSSTEQIAPPEPPLPASSSGVSDYQTLDSLPAPASGGGR